MSNFTSEAIISADINPLSIATQPLSLASLAQNRFEPAFIETDFTQPLTVEGQPQRMWNAAAQSTVSSAHYPNMLPIQSDRHSMKYPSPSQTNTGSFGVGHGSRRLEDFTARLPLMGGGQLRALQQPQPRRQAQAQPRLLQQQQQHQQHQQLQQHKLQNYGQRPALPKYEEVVANRKFSQSAQHISPSGVDPRRQEMTGGIQRKSVGPGSTYSGLVPSGRLHGDAFNDRILPLSGGSCVDRQRDEQLPRKREHPQFVSSSFPAVHIQADRNTPGLVCGKSPVQPKPRHAALHIVSSSHYAEFVKPSTHQSQAHPRDRMPRMPTVVPAAGSLAAIRSGLGKYPHASTSVIEKMQHSLDSLERIRRASPYDRPPPIKFEPSPLKTPQAVPRVMPLAAHASNSYFRTHSIAGDHNGHRISPAIMTEYYRDSNLSDSPVDFSRSDVSPVDFSRSEMSPVDFSRSSLSRERHTPVSGSNGLGINEEQALDCSRKTGLFDSPANSASAVSYKVQVSNNNNLQSDDCVIDLKLVSGGKSPQKSSGISDNVLDLKSRVIVEVTRPVETLVPSNKDTPRQHPAAAKKTKLDKIFESKLFPHLEDGKSAYPNYLAEKLISDIKPLESRAHGLNNNGVYNLEGGETERLREITSSIVADVESEKKLSEVEATNQNDDAVIVVDDKELVENVKYLASSGSINGDKISAEISKTSAEAGVRADASNGIQELTAEGDKDVAESIYEEKEFVWDEYLEETQASPVPAIAFKHVECSVQSGFEKGMKLEVANKIPIDTYWVSTILMTCGQLLRMRPEGVGDDCSFDFWCDVFASDVHQLGWCRSNCKLLYPPEEIHSKVGSNWLSMIEKTLQSGKTPPLYMLDQRTGTLPIDQIKEGMYVEVQHELDPNLVWPVKIIENIGGRLLMRYEGAATAENDFWLFYLHHRLHPIGWAHSHDCCYQPPPAVTEATDVIAGVHGNNAVSELNKAWLDRINDNQPPVEIFKDQIEIVEHKFTVGLKLECLRSATGTCANVTLPNHHLPSEQPLMVFSSIYPATVTRVVNKLYFIVELDGVRTETTTPVRMCCHAQSPGLFPVGWCASHGLDITSPQGQGNIKFDWSEYLAEHSAVAAPAELFEQNKELLQVDSDDQDSLESMFETGMKLEAANPSHPGQICAATVVRVIDRLLWLHLDFYPANVHLVCSDSYDIFPIGWCESNNYPLKAPIRRVLVPVSKTTSAPQPELRDERDEARSALYQHLKNADLGRSSGWCPKIYFNYRCFTGQYLSKSRLVLLPQSVGPGPVTLVMKEVLTMLINVAYKSSRVLRELQLEGRSNPNMHQQVLRAKYKGKGYSATVEICTSSEQVDDFCRDICRRLDCCPNLISTRSYSTETCPDNCSKHSKTKYTTYFNKKKRKIGRPPGGHTNLEGPVKQTGRRKRHRKIILSLRKKHGPTTGRLTTNGEQNEDEYEVDNKCAADDKDIVSWEMAKAEHNDGIGDDMTNVPIEPAKISRKRNRLDPVLPLHEMQMLLDMRTRNLKLPKYSFDSKTHKKVLLHKEKDLLSVEGRNREVARDFVVQAAAVETTTESYEIQTFPDESSLSLNSNPLRWSVQEVVDFLKTTDCSTMARLFKEQEIDGQSMLMLSLPTIQEFLMPKLGPAVKLCHQVERLKIAFYQHYA